MVPLWHFPGWYRRRSLSGQVVPVAALGFAYAAAVVWYGHGWFHLHLEPIDAEKAARSQAFLTRGKTVLWFLLLGIESAVWFTVAAAYARPAPDVIERPATTAREWIARWPPRVAGYALIVVVFFLPLLYSNLFVSLTVSDVSPLLWHGPKMIWIAVPAVTAVVCVIARLRDVEHTVANLRAGTVPERVAAYLVGQDRLRFALGVLGLMLSLNVLTTGALRNALMFDLHQGHDIWLFEMELVLAFGGAYTFLVVAFYAPVYFALSGAGAAIADAAATAGRPAKTTTAELDLWMTERKKWERALGLEQDWLKSAQAGLVLLSPFFAALVSLLLPSGK